MLRVKAPAMPSKIEGIGLFAEEKILKGTITWKFDPMFDILFEPEEVKKMPKDIQNLMNHYAYFSTKLGKYVFPLDDSRFTNHSSTRNNVDSVHLPKGI